MLILKCDDILEILPTVVYVIIKTVKLLDSPWRVKMELSPLHRVTFKAGR